MLSGHSHMVEMVLWGMAATYIAESIKIITK